MLPVAGNNSAQTVRLQGTRTDENIDCRERDIGVVMFFPNVQVKMILTTFIFIGHSPAIILD